MPSSGEEIEQVTVGRTETVTLLAILALATFLRVQDLDQVHIEHFDEGVYGSNRWFTVEEETRYPNRHLYAPPLLPSSLEWSQLIFGTGSWGVLLLPIALGTLTVGLVWWLMRHWTGPVSAMATALIAAISEPHILYSRTALTDVPMIALMLLAIGLAWQAIVSNNWKRSIVAGIVTGLCWSTKYNGWYPLAVSGAGLGAFTLFHVKRFESFPKAWVNWLLICASAILVWLPAWWDLQPAGRGGYFAVQANHSRYVDGPTKWLSNFQHQLENLIWFESSTVQGILSGILILCGCIVFLGVNRSDVSNGRKRTTSEIVLGSLLVVSAGMMAVGPVIPWHPILIGVAVFGYGSRLRNVLLPSTKGYFNSEGALATWFCLAWFVSLLLVTPLYRPYPRLALPLLISLWVGLGFAIEDCWNKLNNPDVSRETNRFHILLGFACLVLVLLFRPTGTSAEWKRTVWQSRLGVEEVARSIVQVCQRSRLDSEGEVPYVIYTYAEPALFYQLCRLAPQDVAIEPVSNLGFVRKNSEQQEVVIFLAIGPHVAGDEEISHQLVEQGEMLEVVSDFPIELSDLVLLNQYSPAVLRSESNRPKSSFRLYRLKSRE